MSNFNEDLAGAFYDLFRSTFSTSMNQNQVDALHANTQKLANLILKQTEAVALKRVKKVNDATKEAFEIVGAEIEELSARVDATVMSLRSTLEALRMVVDDKMEEVIDDTVASAVELASGEESDEDV